MSATWDDTERAALVALLRVRPGGRTWSRIAADVDESGSAVEVWRRLHPADLFDDGADDDAVALARSDIERWRSSGLGFLTFPDADYPAQLRDVHDLPPVLFHRGGQVLNEPAMSVVGSRAAGERGLSIARAVAVGLVDRGITVVSGLAAGIDTAAHQAALDAGGRTVAVIGTGIDHCYPAENRALQERIADEGLLLSQFWPDAPPSKRTFPMRNAVMSGYGCATIVVEAGEHSGARIQARQAVAHGRPVILTDRVVEATEWARELVRQPGVLVASSTAEVMVAAEDVLDQGARTAELLEAVSEPG